MMRLPLMLVLCTGALAQVPSLGKCPDLKVVQNFDVEKYMGTWYEVGQYFVLAELGGKCTTAKYSQNADGTINVLNSQINYLTGKSMSIEGIAKLVGESGEAKLSMSFPKLPSLVKGSVWILDTDYESYAVVFSCQDFKLFNTKEARILTRERIPSEEVLQKAYKTFDASGFSRTFLIHTDQKKCNGVITNFA
ncbi:apolipoprotein D-like [Belonocnema kinseyi]|uniref:apolipoprotein D-like n=1 Tax=Belonocnema kinseyi TaxID=2817044 RepID=UPI00143DDA42|nr:apolipoprotein D-like [Belonocnema kinseyi]